MIIRRTFAAAFVALATMLAMAGQAPANAAPVLQVQGTNPPILTGIDGIDVNGSLYNVAFEDGTCAGVFGACDAAHFTFTTQSDSVAAAHALLDAITGTYFDFLPPDIGGCSDAGCEILTPFGTSHVSPVVVLVEFAFIDGGPPSDFINSAAFSSTLDMTDNGSATYAVWSTPSDVPEPCSWTLLLAGLGLMSLSSRRRALHHVHGMSPIT